MIMSESKNLDDYEYDLVPAFDPDECDSDDGSYAMYYEEDRL